MEKNSWVVKIRERLELTQEEMAQKIGASRRSISRWENGKSMHPLFERAIRELKKRKGAAA